MKEIKAYLHRSRVADVIAALKATPAWATAAEAQGHTLAAYMVKGSLLPLDDDERHYSLDLGDEVINEYKLELHCADEHVDELVSAIRAAGHTGKANSGWIYVVDIAAAVPLE